MSEAHRHSPARRAQRAAWAAVNAARREGRLPYPTKCTVCGVAARSTRDVVWHHHSYAARDRLALTALCLPCHYLVHAGLIPEPATGRVRADAWRPEVCRLAPEELARRTERALAHFASR